MEQNNAQTTRRYRIEAYKESFSRGLDWGGRSEREYVNGQLVAAGEGPLTPEEAAEFSIVG